MAKKVVLMDSQKQKLYVVWASVSRFFCFYYPLDVEKKIGGPSRSCIFFKGPCDV